MTATLRVLIADPLPEEALEPLRGDARFDVVERSAAGGEALARALAGVDAVIIRSMSQITRDALIGADRLRIIGRAGVGVDNIDIAAASEKGIAVLNTPSANTISAAEFTFALILALVRRVPRADRSMKAGAWDRERLTGIELYGRTLGLVGAGRIGREVARRARAFGMCVVACDPELAPADARAIGIEPASLDDVLRRADILSLHVPLTPATADLIDDRAIRKLKPGAFVINAARGGVLDEAALVRALRDGRLAGAALDVFAEEPLAADDPLRTIDSVVLAPHLGAATEEAKRNVGIEIVRAVRDALLSGDVSMAVNVASLGGPPAPR